MEYCVLCLVTQPCPTLCNPVDCSPSGSSVLRDSPGKILQWVTMPSPKGWSQLRNWTQVSHTAGRFFTLWATQPQEEWNKSICSNMDWPRDYHTKWSKSNRERNITWYYLYVECKKKNDTNDLFTNQRQIHRHRKQTQQSPKGKGGGINERFGTNASTVLCIK